MRKIICNIEEGLKAVGFEGLREYLSQKSDYLWERNYPIAVLHRKERIKEGAIAALLEEKGILDDTGLLTQEQLDFVALNSPFYLQQATMVCLKSPTTYPRYFASKFPKDYWKKMQDISAVKSVIEWESFDASADKCSVEFALREVMRKRKEVNVLKKVGYIWIAAVPKGIMIDAVMTHYFGENVTRVERADRVYHIGWNDTLKDINMRYFVCPPS